jgi:uncharacterized protein (DUF488 family)
MDTQTHNTIWTIGHSTMPIEEFAQLLQSNQIGLVVDVRTAPYSRYASQFNKLDLEDALQRRKVGYRYEGKRLGGRPDDPTCYRDGVVPDHAEREDFLKLVDYEAVKQKSWFQEALEEVIELSASHQVALMCSEENPMDCHRHRLIASALDERGIEVLHIRRDRTVKPATFADTPVQVSLF